MTHTEGKFITYTNGVRQKQRPVVRTEQVYVMPRMVARGVRAALNLPPLPIAVFHVRAR